MMDQLIKLRTAFVAGLLMLLVACGGEDTLNGETDGTTGGTDTPVVDNTPQPASLRLLSQNSQIPSDSSTGTELSAIVRDSNNNFLSGVTVTFQADSGGLRVVSATTDASGRASATLDAAGDPQNRIITVQASVSTAAISDSLQVGVTGSTLSLVGPNSVTVNDQVEYLISLRDSAGTGISGEEVSVSSSNGNSLGAQTLVTDFNGELTVTYTANATGTDQLTAAALGLNQGQAVTVSDDTFEFQLPGGTPNESGAIEVPIGDPEDIRVLWVSNGVAVDGGTITFSTTRGTLADASVTTNPNGQGETQISSSNAGPAVITAEGAGGPTAQLKLEFIAQTPTAVDVQAAPSSIGPNDSSTVTAIVRDENGNLVKNQTVLFTLDDVSGGSISTGSAVTDSLGRAQTVYTASDATSAKDGVSITATVQGTSPVVTNQVTLSVSDKALFLTLGSDNEISSGNGTYSIIYSVIVSDSNGNPVEGVSVDFSTIPVAYGTGCLLLTADNLNDDDEPEPTSFCGNFNGKVGKYSLYYNQACANEDVNNNGVNDPGEDANNNGALDPGIRAVIQSSVVTNASGTGEVTLTYSQEYALWYSHTITATARVEGTETTHSASGTLPVLVDDVQGESSPPNETSPFGIGDC